jgi:hypothetical protein
MQMQVGSTALPMYGKDDPWGKPFKTIVFISKVKPLVFDRLEIAEWTKADITLIKLLLILMYDT